MTFTENSKHHQAVLNAMSDKAPATGFARLFISSSNTLVCLLVLMTMQNLSAVELFKAALIAKGSITLSGNNVVDSFNSQNPLYSTNGLYISTKRRDHGNIATLDSNILANVTVGSGAQVLGRIFCGPGDSIMVIGGGSVGSSNWVSAGNSGIQSGYYSTDLSFAIPDAPAPNFTTGLGLPTKAANIFNGTSYSNSYLLGGVLQTNYYKFNSNISLSSSDKILISGNVKLHMNANLSLAGNSQIIIGTNSSLTIYASGNLDFGGNGVANNSGYATNFFIYGQTSNTNINVAGGNQFIGVIYAPYADLIASGSGPRPANISGALLANSIRHSGLVQVHLDESIPGLINFPFSLAAWLQAWRPFSAPDTISIQVLALAGYVHALECSTNLIDWTRMTTNLTPFYFTNFNPTDPQMFYRTVLLE